MKTILADTVRGVLACVMVAIIGIVVIAALHDGEVATTVINILGGIIPVTIVGLVGVVSHYIGANSMSVSNQAPSAGTTTITTTSAPEASAEGDPTVTIPSGPVAPVAPVDASVSASAPSVAPTVTSSLAGPA